jgi:hypothetical protein
MNTSESIHVGQCYLARSGRVRRVLAVSVEEGRVEYEDRRGPVRDNHPWPRRKTSKLRTFLAEIVVSVDCSYRPEPTSPEQKRRFPPLVR